MTAMVSTESLQHLQHLQCLQGFPEFADGPPIHISPSDMPDYIALDYLTIQFLFIQLSCRPIRGPNIFT